MDYDTWLTNPPAERIPPNEDEPDLEDARSDLIGGTAGRPPGWTEEAQRRWEHG